MLFLARSIFLNNKRFYKCQSITQEVAHNKAYSKKLDSINLVTAMQLAPSAPIWSLLFFISREYFSIGSSGRVGGDQETWNLCGCLWRPSFLWLVCTGLGGGTMAPSAPPWIRYWYLHVLLPMNYLLKYYLFKMPLNYNTLKVSIFNEMLDESPQAFFVVTFYRETTRIMVQSRQQIPGFSPFKTADQCV